MWPSFDYNCNKPVLLLTTPVIQPMSPLPRFQNTSNYAQNVKAGYQNVSRNSVQPSSSRSPSSRRYLALNGDKKPQPSVSTKELLEAFRKFECSITEKVNDLVQRNRKMERRVITTLGMNIEAANAKYIANKEVLVNFKTELEEEFSRFESEQRKLLSTMESGMAEIKSVLAEMPLPNDDFNSIIMQLAPKFDESYKNHPLGFLKNFETFIKSTKITPALQRLIFIHAVQLDNPIWRENVANIETYEDLKKPFLNLTWSKKQQTRVYLEFENASFKDLSPEQVNAEVKKWCDIVKNMDNVNFRNFRISLIEKLPRHWQTTLRVFAINDFESLIQHIDLCLDNESVIPLVYAKSESTK